MILVLLGSHEFPFKRMLEVIEEYSINNKEVEIIVQSGATPFQSKTMNLMPYMSSDELDNLYDKADYIITHGGTASIIKGVKKGKKVAALARLKKYNEHIDDHQLQIINEFSKKGYILEWEEGQSLDAIISKMKRFEPMEYKSNTGEIIEFLIEYIDAL